MCTGDFCDTWPVEATPALAEAAVICRSAIEFAVTPPSVSCVAITLSEAQDIFLRLDWIQAFIEFQACSSAISLDAPIPHTLTLNH
jgi:hypothetical protein